VIEHNRRTYIAENVDPERTHLNIETAIHPSSRLIMSCSMKLWQRTTPNRNAKTGASKTITRKSATEIRKSHFMR